MKLVYAFFSVFLIFVSCVAQASVGTDLNGLLKTKQATYVTMIKHYQKLVDEVHQSQFKAFCTEINAIVPTLNQELSDDQALAQALYALSSSTSDSDIYDYAKSIEENSYSDLFANNSFHDRCANQNFEPQAAFEQALKYSLRNVQYLSTTHELWMSAHSF